MNWQPISSAPKDRDILIFWPDEDKHGIERWHQAGMAVVRWSDYDDRFILSHIGGYEWEDELGTSSHWCELEPPRCP